MDHVSVNKKLHVLGVCGKFMSGLAILADRLGYKVIGYDQTFLPPMSLQLKAEGIVCIDGWTDEFLEPNDTVVVGNACKSTNELIIAARRLGLSFMSGPSWLYEHVLKDRQVIAISGTHGKTTTSSWCVEILRRMKLDPGFLIGGVPSGSVFSAHLGTSDYFVIEADEYDSAFFDKRPKFLHFWPKYLLINNLEWDHLDIYPSFDAMKAQYQFLLRTIHPDGVVVCDQKASDELNIDVSTFSLTQPADTSGNYQNGTLSVIPDIHVDIWGEHYAHNILALYTLLSKMGLPLKSGYLQDLPLPLRRLQLKGDVDGVTWYDDFAHHASAIRLTYETLKERYQRIALIIAPTTISQRSAWGLSELKNALGDVNQVAILKVANMEWGADDIPKNWSFIEESQMKSWVGACHAQVALTMGAVYLEEFYNTLLSS